MTDTEPLQPYGKKLRTMRRGHDLTQDQVAAAVGIARSTLASIERGHDPAGRDTLAALAQFYKVTVDSLLDGSPPPRKPKRSDLVYDPDELALLDMWRAFDDTERALLLRMLKGAGGTGTGTRAA